MMIIGQKLPRVIMKASMERRGWWQRTYRLIVRFERYDRDGNVRTGQLQTRWHASTAEAARDGLESLYIERRLQVPFRKAVMAWL